MSQDNNRARPRIHAPRAAGPRRSLDGPVGVSLAGRRRIGLSILAASGLFWLAVALRATGPLVLADEYVYAIRGVALDGLDRLQAIAPALPNVGDYLFLRLINLLSRAHLPIDGAIKLFNVACFTVSTGLIGLRVLPRGGLVRGATVLALCAVFPIGSYVAYVMPECAYLLVFVSLFTLLTGASGQRCYRLWALAGAVIAILTLVKAHGLFVFFAFLGATLLWSATNGRVTLPKACGLCLAAAGGFGAALYAGMTLLGPHGAAGAHGDVIGSYYWEVVARSMADRDRIAAALGFAATQVSAILLLLAPALTFLVFGVLSNRRRGTRGAGSRDLTPFVACFLLMLLCVVVAVVSVLLSTEPNRIQLRYVDFAFPCILALAWMWQSADPALDTPRFRKIAAAVWLLGAAAFLYRLPGLRPLAPDSPEMFFSYRGGEFGAFGLGPAALAVTAGLIAVCAAALLHPRVRWLDAQILALCVLAALADANTLSWQGRWSASQAPFRSLGDAARALCGRGEADIVARGSYDQAAPLYTAMARVGRPIPLHIGEVASPDPIAAPPADCVIAGPAMEDLWGPPLRRAPGVNLYRPSARWRVTANVPFDAGIRRSILGPGWSAPEAHGIWTDGPQATLRLDLPPAAEGDGGRTVVELDAVAFTPPGHADQRVTVSANGRRLTTWTVRDGAYYVRLPPPAASGAAVELVLTLPDAVSPASTLPGAADRRRLGIGVRGLRVLRAGAACPSAGCPATRPPAPARQGLGGGL